MQSNQLNLVYALNQHLHLTRDWILSTLLRLTAGLLCRYNCRNIAVWDLSDPLSEFIIPSLSIPESLSKFLETCKGSYFYYFVQGLIRIEDPPYYHCVDPLSPSGFRGTLVPPAHTRGDLRYTYDPKSSTSSLPATLLGPPPSRKTLRALAARTLLDNSNLGSNNTSRLSSPGLLHRPPSTLSHHTSASAKEEEREVDPNWVNSTSYQSHCKQYGEELHPVFPSPYYIREPYIGSFTFAKWEKVEAPYCQNAVVDVSIKFWDSNQQTESFLDGYISSLKERERNCWAYRINPPGEVCDLNNTDSEHFFGYLDFEFLEKNAHLPINKPKSSDLPSYLQIIYFY
ncbi:hypothetical protein BJ138DRAFT_1118956 [Hygrophoropsis aurantiaca]|uniref:Uncharacterized protein n=1 Tax=Hygrophoropsis aurantiaca TaxID=72124 RepID=A0ACB7ZV13_9AGAM|nr:hypothetical protein BJ138DRAFT_1118956 [Hygrophoropsis aurantiaca]